MSMIWIAILAVAAVAILVVALRRKPSADNAADLARTEAATHRLYEQEDAADHARDDRVER